MHAIFSSVAKQISQALKNVSYKKKKLHKISQTKQMKSENLKYMAMMSFIQPTYLCILLGKQILTK